MKVCPILEAGTMVESISVEKQIRPDVVSTHSDNLRHKPTDCMGEQCEWYGHGCPAHPCYTGPAGETPPKS